MTMKVVHGLERLPIRDAELQAADCVPKDYGIQRHARGRHVRVGSWCAPMTARKTEHPSDAACPFCECLMVEIRCAEIARVVRECTQESDDCDGVVALLPKTHRALACRPCGLIFTEPV